jgi:hypothetical protein
MHNWHAIENEAEFRRQEWERTAAADARAALACPERPKLRWLRLPKLSLPGLSLQRLAAPGLSLPAPAAPRRPTESYSTVRPTC